MSSIGLQEDGFGSLELNKSKHDSEVVARTASPRAFEITF